MTQGFSRGSEWRKWDMHIHTPASFQWDGERFRDMTESNKKASIDAMIAAMNQSDVAVFVIMDYWTFDGWISLKKRLTEVGAPTLTKKVFPGIELRLVSPTEFRLNVHAVFSDTSTDQELADFKSALNVALIEQPLSDECLVKLARTKIGSDKLAKIGRQKQLVDQDDKIAFDVGASCAEITAESYKSAFLRFPEGKAIPFIPWDTYNGLIETKWEEHYAYAKGLMAISPIFETRDDKYIAAFNRIENLSNKKWYQSFQATLGNKAHLAVSGSDAHRYNGIPGDNNKRGYGNFPNERNTWINADTTFKGLLQAMKEPAKRCFIGDLPPKLKVYHENKTFFIDSIKLTKAQTSTTTDEWVDGVSIKINPDLVAIIGNKGSGKSALADIMALLGNTKQYSHFSFLRGQRFRGKKGEPAKSFSGQLTWASGATSEKLLSEDPTSESVEMVRYIAQGLFEDLCNGHASGKNDVFERELRSVIFSHIPHAKRLGTSDFDELTAKQETQIRDELAELRKELQKCNDDISSVESRLQPELRRSLIELQKQKQLQIDENEKIKPIQINKPSEEITPEQALVSNQVDAIKAEIAEINLKVIDIDADIGILTDKLATIRSLLIKIQILENYVSKFSVDAKPELDSLSLVISDIINFKTDRTRLDKLKTECDEAILNQEKNKSDLLLRKSVIIVDLTNLHQTLNAPQKEYQDYLQLLANWQSKYDELIGNATLPESLHGLVERVAQIDRLPHTLKQLEDKRAGIAGSIFECLVRQKENRSELYSPVQALIENNRLIRDEYKLQFQSKLDVSIDKFSSLLFDLIRRTSGKFRGEGESFEVIRQIFGKYDLSTKEQMIDFCSDLLGEIRATYTVPGGYGITNALKGDHKPSKLYDFIFGLEYIEPRYSLQFQSAQIEQLSPGQRGALLLIFYLLVDKGFNPIILDQPEDNLDNETVVSLLVPVLTEAKKRRQIIMVTHNPNLAVVCDAEQVIYSSFDRANKCKITYESGSIENPSINRHIIDVLEGTRPAFDNRSEKYQ